MARPLVELEHVTKKYGKFKAVDDASFKAGKGSILAVLGPNGAGKTTTFRCILGLLKYAGNITVDGMDSRNNGAGIRKIVGYLPQHSACYDDMTVRENLKYFAALKGVGKERVSETLNLIRLEKFKDRKAVALSGGMRQRLMLGISQLADPPILILDEPTANLDVQGQLEFRTLLSKFLPKGKLVIISTHLLREAHEISLFHGNVLVFNNGKVIGTGGIDDFLAEFGLREHMMIDVNKNDPKKMIKTLKDIGFTDIEEKGGQIVLSCEREEKYKVLKTLNDAGLDIGVFRVEEPSLESLFLKITGWD